MLFLTLSRTIFCSLSIRKGSQALRSADKEKDLQLKAAIDLLDGKTVNPTPQKAEAPKKDGETTSAN